MDRLTVETKMIGGEAGAVSGIAWPFGKADRIGDLIERGAFKSLRLPMPMLFAHDHDDPVGVWEAGEEKADGLHLSGRLLVEEIGRAREVHALVKAGAVRGISIGFTTLQSIQRPGGGRTIKALDVVEASLVAIPMHPGARVTSAKSAVEALRVAEAITRAAAQIAAR